MVWGADGANEGYRLQAIELAESPVNRHPVTKEPLWFCNLHNHSRHLRDNRPCTVPEVGMTETFYGDLSPIPVADQHRAHADDGGRRAACGQLPRAPRAGHLHGGPLPRRELVHLARGGRHPRGRVQQRHREQPEQGPEQVRRLPGEIERARAAPTEEAANDGTWSVGTLLKGFAGLKGEQDEADPVGPASGLEDLSDRLPDCPRTRWDFEGVDLAATQAAYREAEFPECPKVLERAGAEGSEEAELAWLAANRESMASAAAPSWQQYIRPGMRVTFALQYFLNEA